jgi:hypothetical protein
MFDFGTFPDFAHGAARSARVRRWIRRGQAKTEVLGKSLTLRPTLSVGQTHEQRVN